MLTPEDLLSRLQQQASPNQEEQDSKQTLQLDNRDLMEVDSQTTELTSPIASRVQDGLPRLLARGKENGMPPILGTMSGMLQGMMSKVLPRVSEEELYSILSFVTTEILYWRDGVYYAASVETSEDGANATKPLLGPVDSTTILAEGDEAS